MCDSSHIFDLLENAIIKLDTRIEELRRDLNKSHEEYYKARDELKPKWHGKEMTALNYNLGRVIQMSNSEQARLIALSQAAKLLIEQDSDLFEPRTSTV